MTADWHTFGRHYVWAGDNLPALRVLPDNSIDAVVTDPPYGLEFMGSDWDAPWKYGFTGQGFSDGANRRPPPTFTSAKNPTCRACGKRKRTWADGPPKCSCVTPDYPNERAENMRLFQRWVEDWAREVLRVVKPGGYMLSFGGTRTYHRMVAGAEDAGWEIKDLLAWIHGQGMNKVGYIGGADNPVKPGWGGSLKPAVEPIVLARKPLAGTIADNLSKWGTGALNIDGCRISTEGEVVHAPQPDPTRRTGAVGANLGISKADVSAFQAAQRASAERATQLGRWPSNVIHDGSDDVVSEFPDTKTWAAKPEQRDRGTGEGSMFGLGGTGQINANQGSAARFFYCAKPGKADRAGLAHVTIKPLALMRYLVRLVTPPGGVVLDPFLGSGTTLLAAEAEQVRCVGMERQYLSDITLRWSRYTDSVREVP